LKILSSLPKGAPAKGRLFCFVPTGESTRGSDTFSHSARSKTRAGALATRRLFAVLETAVPGARLRSARDEQRGGCGQCAGAEDRRVSDAAAPGERIPRLAASAIPFDRRSRTATLATRHDSRINAPPVSGRVPRGDDCVTRREWRTASATRGWRARPNLKRWRTLALKVGTSGPLVRALQNGHAALRFREAACPYPPIVIPESDRRGGDAASTLRALRRSESSGGSLLKLTDLQT
jgi:hypothetical protein